MRVCSSDQPFHTAALSRVGSQSSNIISGSSAVKGSTGEAFPWRCASSVLTAGALDIKGGHELITDVGRDIGLGTCEVVVLTSTVTSYGRLTGRLIPGGLCGGGLSCHLNSTLLVLNVLKPHYGTPLTWSLTQQVSSSLITHSLLVRFHSHL